MKKLIYPILVLSSMFYSTAAHAQCNDWEAYGFTCSGPNQCSQFLSLLTPYFGSVKYNLIPEYPICCGVQYQDYIADGYCDDGAFNRGVLKDRDVMEFALTHNLWLADCSGRYRPFARTWDATRPINLKPRLTLSGIGG